MIAPLLGACANSESNAAVTNFGATGTAERFRESGAQETTLAAFCKSRPQALSEAGSAAIKASCSPRVLARVGDAMLFAKGNGVYHVVFKQPIKNREICDKDTPPESICGNFAAGDTMRSSRIDAS